MCLFAVTTLLPACERGRDERVRGLGAAHRLDDDVDVAARDEVRRRVGEQRLRDAVAIARSANFSATAASTSGAPSVGARRGDRSRNARTTSRPTVPAPMHADAQGLDAHGWAGSDGAAAVRRRWYRTRLAPGRRARERAPLHSAPMTVDLAPLPAPLAGPPARPRIFSGIQPSGHRPPRQRPRRDPQLRDAPVRVRGDLLHRRLPRAHEHPRPGRCCASGRARWRPACSPWASTPSAARCSSRATAPSTPSSSGCSRP